MGVRTSWVLDQTQPPQVPELRHGDQVNTESEPPRGPSREGAVQLYLHPTAFPPIRPRSRIPWSHASFSSIMGRRIH